MTVSFHMYGPFFFPGTGAVDDVGEQRGRFCSLNVPLTAGTDNGTFLRLFKRVMRRTMEVYQPECVVLQCGAPPCGAPRWARSARQRMPGACRPSCPCPLPVAECDDSQQPCCPTCRRRKQKAAPSGCMVCQAVASSRRGSPCAQGAPALCRRGLAGRGPPGLLQPVHRGPRGGGQVHEGLQRAHAGHRRCAAGRDCLPRCHQPCRATSASLPAPLPAQCLCGGAGCQHAMVSSPSTLPPSAGGGYTKENVARCWTYETACLVGCCPQRLQFCSC